MATGRIIRPRTQEGWDLLVQPASARCRVQINNQSSLAHGLHDAYVFSSNNKTSLVRQKNWTASGAPAIFDDHVLIYNDGQGLNLEALNLSNFSEMTLSILYEKVPTLVSNNFSRLLSVQYSGSDDVRLMVVSDTRIDAAWDDGTVTTQAGSTTTLPVTTPVLYSTSHNGTEQKYFINGKSAASPASDPFVFSGTKPVSIGRLVTAGSSAKGKYFLIFIHNRVLTEAEQKELARNPYQLLRPANDTPFLYSITGGATVTLSSPTATATGPTTANVGCTVTYT